MVRGSDDSQNVGYEKALNMSSLSIIPKISRWNKKQKNDILHLVHLVIF